MSWPWQFKQVETRLASDTGTELPPDVVERLHQQFNQLVEEAIYGGRRRQRDTALVCTGYGFVSREIGDDGKLIEPCPYCGPVLLCSKHMSMIS